MKARGRAGLLAAALGAVLAAGCILPVATGTPMPATTVGKGNFGIAMTGEAPVLDLIADSADESFEELHGVAPAAALTTTVSVGLGESTDLEVSAEGALYYFLLPMPTGGAIGVRQHLTAAELFDFAVAARFGGVSSFSDGDDSASAVYGAVQGVAQLRRGFVRPLASLNLMPFRIRRGASEPEAFTSRGLASSATFGVMFVSDSVQFGPFVTVTSFEGERLGGAFFGSGGLMLAIRPDRNRPRREPEPPPYPPPYPPPGSAPYPPPGSAPYPPPGPGPAPYPPPGPGPAPYPPPAVAPYPPPAPGPAPAPPPSAAR
ncbi:MAG TPA: hypothetical protein VNO30_35050 [Kofleriaceae bacterium]|nr:hypothetical protein [Kofleriaceae bacterium]